MFTILFSQRGEKDLRKLPVYVQQRILNKILDYAQTTNPFNFAKPLINLPPATHRFRVGKYRIFFFIKDQTIYVERVQLRGEAY